MLVPTVIWGCKVESLCSFFMMQQDWIKDIPNLKTCTEAPQTEKGQGKGICNAFVRQLCFPLFKVRCRCSWKRNLWLARVYLKASVLPVNAAARFGTPSPSRASRGFVAQEEVRNQELQTISISRLSKEQNQASSSSFIAGIQLPEVAFRHRSWRSVPVLNTQIDAWWYG